MSTRKENIKLLEDGKNNWREKKLDNIELTNSFLRLSQSNDTLREYFANVYENVYQCASYLEFKYYSETDTKKLNKAGFCKNRLCSMCAWRRSKKTFAQVSKIVQEIDKTKEFDYIFLTLTIQNCLGKDLDNTISLISKAFTKMIRDNKRVKAMCRGYFRAIEVTYNKKENTYHPHIHCIIAINKNYFKKIGYIKTKEWSDIWQYYIKSEYKPIVDVRKVTQRNYKYSGVSEISKYTVKSKDVILKNKNGQVNTELTDNNVYTLHFALKGKRLITYGGIFKELHKKLNLDDLNSNEIDLINTDVEDTNELLNYIILKFKWNVGYSNYQLIENRYLT